MGNSNYKVEMPNLARHYLEGRLEPVRLVSVPITLHKVRQVTACWAVMLGYGENPPKQVKIDQIRSK